MRQLIQNRDIRKKVKRVIATVVFLAVLAKVFVSATYLFRNSGTDRLRVVGIREEESLDMVCVGGSAMYMYWEPLRAWNEHGFTSYDLCVSGVQAENIKYMTQYAMECQQPQLLVIDARPFQYYGAYGRDEAGFRNVSDSLDLSPERMQMVREYIGHHREEEGIDVVSFYLDIAKYHTNLSALTTEEAWKLVDNRGTAANKGSEWGEGYKNLSMPEDFLTEERGELCEESLEMLYDLLEYCSGLDCEILFLICPYQITAEEQMQYNTVKDIVTSYGFDFLNTNEYYDEMDLDFSTDFWNEGHVNCFGAAKYTEFLGQYIEEFYDLPDHRGEAAYAGWDAEYQWFLAEQEEMAADTLEAIHGAQDTEVFAGLMPECTDVLKWCGIASDERFTVLVCGTGVWDDLALAEDRLALTVLGLELPRGENYIRAVSGREELFSNDESGETSVLLEGGEFYLPCQIENGEGEMAIWIDGEDYSRHADGLNLVVYESGGTRVIDSVTLVCDETGRLELVR